MMYRELERDAERLLVRGVKRLGGLCYKFTSPGNSGVPDRIVVLNGSVFFVELKKPDGKTTALQDRQIALLRQNGATVFVLYGMEAVTKWLTDIEAFA
jgi:hypothetical protein